MRRGTSSDAKAAGAVAFAKALNDNLGEVTGAEFDAARAAGLSDGEIVEITGPDVITRHNAGAEVVVGLVY